jgi:hypothetical protein
MQANQVVQFRRRLKPFDAAVAAFKAADLDECLSALGGHEGPEAAALRARAYLRTGQPGEAIDELGAEIDPALPHQTAAELLALKAAAHVKLAEFDVADALLLDARIHACLSGNPEVEAEVEFLTARLHWATGALDQVKSSVARTLDAGTAPASWLLDKPVRSHFLAISESRARAKDLLGLVAAVEHDFERQATLIREAISELEASPQPDPYTYACLLMNLAVLVRDLDGLDVYEFLRTRTAEFRFTPSTKVQEFYVRRAIGMRHALHGDHIGGLREFRLSADAAPSQALRIIALLDRVVLAREIGERIFAQEELEHALSLSASIDWSSDRVPDRFPLFMLAQELAQHRTADARRLLDRYFKLKTPAAPNAIGRLDPRFTADENVAVAAVLRAEGEERRAAALLLDAFETFSTIGYMWRAALVAADLAEITGEPKFFAFAMSQAEVRPQSWLTRRLRSIAQTRLPAAV